MLFGVAWRSAAGRKLVVRLVAFTATAVAAIVGGFLYFTPVKAGELVRQYGYFGIAGTLIWFLVLVRRDLPAARSWVRVMTVSEFKHLCWMVGGLSVLAWVAFPLSYKVMFDELVLQATSWNLHRMREVGTIVRGYDVEGVFLPLFVYVDKRPYFFAFLVSLVHDVLGFRESNGFLFNAVLFPMVLVLFYAIVRRLAPARVALAGLACFGATPLLAQNANGSGMDLLNLGMILLTILLAARYLQRPDDHRLSVLLIACVLLAQTRYESLLFVVTTGLVVIEGWRRAGRVLLPVTAILTPLLLIPSGLHNSYLSGTPALWELKENMDSRFNFVHVMTNLQHAWSYFFNLGFGSLGSIWLSLCGLPALLVGLFLAGKHWRSWRYTDSTIVSVMLAGIAILANLGLLMAYFWGQLDDPIVSRLIMPFTVLMGVAIVVALRTIESRGWPLARWVLGGALLYHLSWGLPAANHHRRINQLANEMEWEVRAISRMSPRSRLILTDKSSLNWMIRGIPSIILENADSRAEQIQFHLDHGTFEEVLVTQRIRPISIDGGFEVDPRDRISARFVLEPVIERMHGARLVRISRVVEIKAEPEQDQSMGTSSEDGTDSSV